jgi:hypothetical protein
MEQLPSLLKFIEGQGTKSFTWDFYEQGIQRRIVLTQSGETLGVECMSYLNDRSVPVIERSICDLKAWHRMILKFWEEFSGAVLMVAPEALQHTWWKNWAYRASGS